MAKMLVSEHTILDAAKRGEKVVSIGKDWIVTSAARDRAKQLGVRIEFKSDKPAAPVSEPKPPGSRAGKPEIVCIGSDHGGFQMKEQLKKHVEQLGYKVVDLGTYSEEACDYPDFAYAVARMVSLGQASKGIMIDAVGSASAIVANKIPGIRAVCAQSEFAALSSREHNDANVLTLGGRVLGIELAKSIVEKWLGAWFGGGRHQKRLDKIAEIEKRFSQRREE